MSRQPHMEPRRPMRLAYGLAKLAQATEDLEHAADALSDELLCRWDLGGLARGQAGAVGALRDVLKAYIDRGAVDEIPPKKGEGE